MVNYKSIEANTHPFMGCTITKTKIYNAERYYFFDFIRIIIAKIAAIISIHPPISTRVFACKKPTPSCRLLNTKPMTTKAAPIIIKMSGFLNLAKFIQY